MSTALKAHFDGERIILDEAFALPANAQLLITVLPPPDIDADEADWLRSASSSEAFAFLADPAEDIYTLNDGQPFRDDV